MIGVAISALVYALYLAAVMFGCISYLKNNAFSFLLCLSFTMHFNVTSFSNIAIAWTGEFILLIFVLIAEVAKLLQKKKSALSNLSTRGWMLQIYVFCGVLLVGVFLSLIREIDLSATYGMSPFIRSVKSYAKFLIFASSFYAISCNFASRLTFKEIVNCISIASIIPSLAAFYQTYGSSQPMYLIHNNNTFRQVTDIIPYVGQRSVGFSDESSFFALILTFSFLATLVSLEEPNFKRKLLFFALLLLQIISLVLSMSRTGMIGFLIVAVVYYAQKSFKTTLKAVVAGGLVVLSMNYLSVLSGIQFSLADRFSSIFSIEYSISNIERYGIAQSLFNMAKSDGAWFGYGFFNYMYHIKDYFSPLMAGMSYESPENIPSFNLILQLVCELGYIPVVVFLIFILIRSKRKPTPIQSDGNEFRVAYLLGVLTYAFSVNVLAFGVTYFIVYLSNIKYREA